MSTLSIDVGIKNLALCLLSKEGDKYKIDLWNVVNLLESKEDINRVKPTCNCKLKTKKQEKICGKAAKYYKNDIYYCLQHAKSSDFIVPSNKTTEKYIKKQKVDDLRMITIKLGITYETSGKQKRVDYINDIMAYYKSHCLSHVFTCENIPASKVDLITIGHNMKHHLNKLLQEHIHSISKVVIENQISPIANRMKTIQGMLAQYFIMQNDNIHIQFVNASNKLKVTEIIHEVQNTDTYKERKSQGITNTLEYLQKLVVDGDSWKTYFKDNKKKDDLADSFLQGIWYIRECE